MIGLEGILPQSVLVHATLITLLDQQDGTQWLHHVTLWSQGQLGMRRDMVTACPSNLVILVSGIQ